MMPLSYAVNLDGHFRAVKLGAISTITPVLFLALSRDYWLVLGALVVNSYFSASPSAFYFHSSLPHTLHVEAFTAV